MLIESTVRLSLVVSPAEGELPISIGVQRPLPDPAAVIVNGVAGKMIHVEPPTRFGRPLDVDPSQGRFYAHFTLSVALLGAQ